MQAHALGTAMVHRRLFQSVLLRYSWYKATNSLSLKIQMGRFVLAERTPAGGPHEAKQDPILLLDDTSALCDPGRIMLLLEPPGAGKC